MVDQVWDGKSYKEPSTLVKLIDNAVSTFGPNKFMGTRLDSGEYEWITYRDFGKRIPDVRGGLAKLGIKESDKVSYIGFNSVEWALTAFATYELKGVYVPMYEREIAPTIKYIINDAEIKLLVVANRD